MARNTGNISNTGAGSFENTGKVKVKGDIIVRSGLDEEAVKAYLDKQTKQLTQELKAQGHAVTAEVERKLRDIVESKFAEFVCDIRAEQVDSEERVKKAIQKKFKELQDGSTVLFENFSAVLNEKLAEGNKLLQSISELQDKAAYYAEERYNALYSRLDDIRERVERISDREARKDREKVSFLQNQLEYGHSALQSAEFDRAKKYFEAVTASNLSGPDLALVANAHFGIALAEWQIQLIWDDVKNSEQFIIYKYDIDLRDKHGSYRDAIKNATPEQADLFGKFVDKLERAKEKLCYYRDNELSYDCFICTKVTADKDGAKTDDWKWIEKTKLYEALKKSKPFYSEVNCKEYAFEQGTLEYESLIYYALSRARVMLLVCSDMKYLESPWVENEINRFRQFCKKRGENPLERIIVVHKDTAVELPSDLDEKYQGWNRNETDVETIVKTVETAVAKAKGYVERGWMYCPQCGKRYSLDSECCNSRKCPAYPNRTLLVDELMWANIKYARDREGYEKEIEKLNERDKKRLAEISEKEKIIAKQKDEIEKLEKAKSALEEERAKLGRENSIGERQYADLVKEKIALDELYSALGKQHSFLKKENSALERQKSDWKKQKSDLEGGIHALEGSLKSMSEAGQEKISQLKNEIIDLSNKVQNFDSLIIQIEDLLKLVGKTNGDTNEPTPHPQPLTDEEGGAETDEEENEEENEGSSPYPLLENYSKTEFEIEGTVLKRYIGKETEVKIPLGVTSIGLWAFWGCSGLTSITIPDSVTSIDGGAFRGCKNLTIYCETSEQPSGWDKNWNPDNRPVIWNCRISAKKSDQIKLYDKSEFEIEGTDLKEYFNKDFSGEVKIPRGVTSIGKDAFRCCRGLTSIIIPEGVKSIGDWAFYDCSELTSITIPKSVTSIGEGAFCYCSGLTSIIIPDSVTTIGESAFNSCSGLTSITIPKSVITIGNYAFSGCSGLTSITIPNSVKSIGWDAFEDCSGLTSITIPEGVTSIGEVAFAGCSGLTSITIPASVTSIGYRAFRDCSRLTSIIIPKSVTSIGFLAFSGCEKLTIYCEASKQPSGWHKNWNPDNRPVVWRYKKK